MFTTRFQVAYLVSTLAIFCAVAFFTRARARRIAGAVCSVVVFVALAVTRIVAGPARADLRTPLTPNT